MQMNVKQFSFNLMKNLQQIRSFELCNLIFIQVLIVNVDFGLFLGRTHKLSNSGLNIMIKLLKRLFKAAFLLPFFDKNFWRDICDKNTSNFKFTPFNLVLPQLSRKINYSGTTFENLTIIIIITIINLKSFPCLFHTHTNTRYLTALNIIIYCLISACVLFSGV